MPRDTEPSRRELQAELDRLREQIRQLQQEQRDRRAAQEALRESEARFRSLFESLPDALIVAEQQSGRIADLNTQAETLLGKSREELLGQPYTALHPEWYLEKAAENFSRHVRELEVAGRATPMDSVVANAQGRDVPVEVMACRMTLEGREHVLGAFRDVTERKQAEEALRRKTAELDYILTALPDALVYADTKRRIMKVNPAFTKMFGYQPEEVLGQPTRIIYKHPEEFEEQGRRRYNPQARNLLEPYEIEYVRKDGSSFVSETVGTPVRDDQDHVVGLLGLVRDVTERKQAEEALRASLQDKETLLKEIHHRVKNNMQVIISLLSLETQNTGDALLTEAAAKCRNRIHAMAMVHEQLYKERDISRIDVARYARKLFNSLKLSFGPEAEKVQWVERGDGLRLPIDVAIPCGLMLNEILTNSLKHAFEDWESGCVTFQAEQHEDAGVIRVGDNGSGWAPDFDPGQAESLGLVLVHNLAAQIRGNLRVSADQGVLYEITFPLEAPS
jgi:PAS domain S-box-containing protein